jgi:hypothetical protein
VRPSCALRRRRSYLCLSLSLLSSLGAEWQLRRVVGPSLGVAAAWKTLALAVAGSEWDVPFALASPAAAAETPKRERQ